MAVSPAGRLVHTLARLGVRRARPTFLFALVILGVVVGPSIAPAQQLDLTWVDNSGGQASFIIQRATGSTGAYVQIAQVPVGVVSYTDTAVARGTNYCYEVAAVNNAGMSDFSNIACGNPSGGFTLAVTKAGTGAGSVASSPAGINCGTTCSYTYPVSSPITLTATPSSGSTFSGWSGGGCSGTDSCTLVGNVSGSVTATFVAAGAVAVGSVAPNQGARGAVVPVTITGSGFAAGATVAVSGTGVTVSNASVGSASQMTATLGIASGAALGTRDVTVTNSGGAGATLTGGFTVVSAAPATLTLVYNGKLRDRVGQGNVALAPDGALDGTLTATLSASGGRAVTGLRLDSDAPGTWDTSSATGYWVLAVAPSLDGALLNTPGTMAVNFPVPDGGSFVLFASDYLGGEFLPGRTLTVTATFSDGATATASTMVPGAPVSAAPPPTLTSISPAAVGVGGGAFTLTATGTDFVSTSVVQVNGSPRATAFVSATQLTATVPASDTASVGALSITVVTPAPGGGISAIQPLTVRGTSLTVSATTAHPGDSITATLTNSPGGSTDWLGLAPVGSPDTTFLQWIPVGAGLTNRTWTVTMPATVGLYEFRFYPNNGYTVSARSPAVSVATSIPGTRP